MSFWGQIEFENLYCYDYQNQNITDNIPRILKILQTFSLILKLFNKRTQSKQLTMLVKKILIHAEQYFQQIVVLRLQQICSSTERQLKMILFATCSPAYHYFCVCCYFVLLGFVSYLMFFFRRYCVMLILEIVLNMEK